MVATLPLLVALAAFAFMTSGCDSTTGIVTETYTDADFGFSFEYPSDWEIDSDLTDVADYVSASVAAFDPYGAGVEDYGLDQVVVDIWEIIEGEELTLDDLKADFQSWLDSSQEDYSVAVVGPITETSVGGLQGFKATITYDQDGTAMRSTEYWLLGDGLVYNLYTDSSEDHWDGNQGIMEKFITTFTP